MLFFASLSCMKGKVTLDAPCKLNLHLDVGERRPDGYHNLQSIFQLISLCDTLAATKIEKNECRVRCSGMALPADNTIARAFGAFRQHTGIKGGAAFELAKRVPSGAGLGGGSSDGAAAIRALDALYGTRLSMEEMEDMALKIGSDCPFFIRGGAALVGGRGEKIFRLEDAPKRYGALIWPDVHSSTREAYSLLDASRADAETAASLSEDVAAMQAEYLKAPSEWRFCNSFAPLLCAKYPSINKALADIREAGAAFCSMTGSGSAVFGIFNNERDAQEAHRRLSRLWASSFLFFFLAFSPDVTYHLTM